MRILWLTWKDTKNPLAGGAEFINQEIARRLAADGHQVTFLVAGFPGCRREEFVDGYRIIRLGSRFTVYLKAFAYYCRHLKDWADVIIEEVNTIPFLTQIYTRGESRVLLIFQLCRRIWFYQMVFPLNLLGYLLEPLYLFVMRKNVCITESESTLKDLARFGFQPERICLIPICIEMEPAANLQEIEKYRDPTLLSLGALRNMKRTTHQIKAFELAKKEIPRLKLLIAGDGVGKYKKKVMRMMEKSPYRDDITYLGRVDPDQKRELLARSHLLLATSVKEGWGLTVTEAASQGTPTVAYDVDGLRDSVRDGCSGMLCGRNTPRSMAARIVELLSDPQRYERVRRSAWEASKGYSAAKCYRSFLDILVEYAQGEEGGGPTP